MMGRLILLSLLVLVASVALAGQPDDGESAGDRHAASPAALTGTARYDAEALRLKHGIFSTKLVCGIDDQVVASFGAFPNDVPTLSRRDDEIGRHFRSFHTKYKVATYLYVLGFAAGVGAILAEDDSSTAGALWLAGLGLVFTGAGVQVSGYESLSRSVWHFNRTLHE